MWYLWLAENAHWLVPAAVAVAGCTPTKKDDKVVLLGKRIYDKVQEARQAKK